MRYGCSCGHIEEGGFEDYCMRLAGGRVLSRGGGHRLDAAQILVMRTLCMRRALLRIRAKLLTAITSSECWPWRATAVVFFLPPAVPPGCRQARLLPWTAGGKGQPAWSPGLDRGRGDHLSAKTVDMNGPFRLRFASIPGYLKLTVDTHQL